MYFATEQFRDVTLALFLIYFLYETRSYLIFWVLLLSLLNMAMEMFSFDATTCKITVSAYVVGVLVGYLYVFRNILLGREEALNNGKLIRVSSDKRKQQRIGVALLLLLIVNIASAFTTK
jgi:hypothetical protein